MDVNIMNLAADLKCLREARVWKEEKFIDRGSFGDVYLFTHVEDERQVAVKEMRFSANTKNEMDKAIREISINEQLSHERIVAFLGSYIDDKDYILYICLEYMPGGSLYSILRKTGPQNLSTAAKYTRQMLEGVAYLHKRNIIHRDIKGKNILLDDRENNIKLADFGISKNLEALSSNCDKTAGVGTIKWMAPEVVKGNCYSFEVDIWSVGCTVVEMLTAYPPWQNDQETVAIGKISRGQYPSYELPEPCEDVEDFLRQCFQLDPSKRSSAEELLKSNICKLRENEKRNLTPGNGSKDSWPSEKEENIADQTSRIFCCFAIVRFTNYGPDEDNVDYSPAVRELNLHQPSKVESYVARNLAIIADDIDKRYASDFKRMIALMKVTPDTAYEAFANVARQLFSDGVLSWGRVVTLFCFGFHMAREALLKSIHDFFSKAVTFVCKFILTEKIACWIACQGGWSAALLKVPGNGGWGSIRFIGTVAVIALAGIFLLKK